MFIQALLVALAVYLFYFYYTRVYLTKQAMENYGRLFEKAGYRVKITPFRLFGFGVFDMLLEDDKKHRNPSYTL